MTWCLKPFALWCCSIRAILQVRRPRYRPHLEVLNRLLAMPSAGFNLLLSGHTHGGQLCLPGGIPVKLEAALPRSMGAGPWHYAGMAGYTSVGVGTSLLPVRLNCPPEITLHTFRCPR